MTADARGAPSATASAGSGGRPSGLAGVHGTTPGRATSIATSTRPPSCSTSISQPHLITDKIRTALPLQDRIVFTGLENELLDGDAEAIAELRELIAEASPQVGFGISTGRSLEAAARWSRNIDLPQPDVYITQLGGEIHYGARLVPDDSWDATSRYRWEPRCDPRGARRRCPGSSLQPEAGSQHRFKISYDYDPDRRRRGAGRSSDCSANGICRPRCCSPTTAGSTSSRCARARARRSATSRCAGDSPPTGCSFYARRGSDYEALSGQFLAVLGADHAPELKPSQNLPRVYLRRHRISSGCSRDRAYRFFDESIRVPESAGGMEPDDAATTTRCSHPMSSRTPARTRNRTENCLHRRL